MNTKDQMVSMTACYWSQKKPVMLAESTYTFFVLIDGHSTGTLRVLVRKIMEPH